MDSIYALSSGAVPSGVAVIRISGPKAGAALAALAAALPEPRRAALRILRRPADGAVIDQGLVLWFPGPRSETGEDMAELQVHGSRAVVQALFAVLGGLGLRLARPGEFARRAFHERQARPDGAGGPRRSRRGGDGGAAAPGASARRVGRWRGARKAGGQTLIALRAEIEARLDFSDEGDVAEALPRGFRRRVAALTDEMREALAGLGAGERVREGFRVAILGGRTRGNRRC